MTDRLSPAGAKLLRQGRELLGAGDTTHAEACLRRVLAESSDHSEALHLLGVIALRRDEPERALSLIERAAARRRSDPHCHNNLGIALSRLGRAESAERAFRRALRIDPTLASAHSHLGAVLADQGRHEEALQAHTRAVRLSPDSASLHFNRGRTQKNLGRLEEAAESYHRAIACAPAEAAAHHALGIVLGLLGRYPEAEASLQQALTLQPGYVDALLALGLIMVLSERFDEALAAYDRALELSPGDTEVHAKRASALLHLGSLRAGWLEYERRIPIGARLDNPAGFGAAPIVLQRPSSLAQQVLGGKRLLLVREQGIGDELFFLGFAKLAKARGAWIAYLASEPLRGLLARAADLDAVVGPDALAPNVDIVLSVGDLPGLLGIESFTDIPPPLVLVPSADRIGELTAGLAALPDGPLLGVTWRGGTIGRRDNQLREVAPSALAAALASWPGPVLVLQRNPKQTEIATFARALGRQVYDFSELNSDLEGMLALLSLLEEYVCIGNTNTHLRATLGRESRVLVPQRADWMWGARGATSPWFPHFRLYRATAEGRWDGPLETLKVALAARQHGA